MISWLVLTSSATSTRIRWLLRLNRNIAGMCRAGCADGWQQAEGKTDCPLLAGC